MPTAETPGTDLPYANLYSLNINYHHATPVGSLEESKALK